MLELLKWHFAAADAVVWLWVVPGLAGFAAALIWMVWKIIQELRKNEFIETAVYFLKYTAVFCPLCRYDDGLSVLLCQMSKTIKNIDKDDMK